MATKKKKGIMVKLARVLAGVLAVVVVLMVGAVVWINPIVKNAVNIGGPKMLGVPVSVEGVSISLWSGTFDFKQLYVGNPENYATNMPLFAVDSVYVEVDMKSLFGDILTIRKIQVDSPKVTYEKKGDLSNFDVLMESLAKADKEKKEKEEKEGKKVIIEEFTLNKARVSYASSLTFGKFITLPIPSLTLRDIGKAEGSISAAKATGEILESLGKDVVGVASSAAGALGDAISDGAKEVGSLVKDGVKAIGEEAKDAAKATKEAVQSIKNLF